MERHIDSYQELVADVKRELKRRTCYGNKKIHYAPCKTWESGNQINLWTYWQGYQLYDIDEKHVDVLLVGQDWGRPSGNLECMAAIKSIQSGNPNVAYYANSPTDTTLTEMFKELGCDITSKNPGKRLFFTNYSLGYRDGPETGGMTKTLMRMDSDLFNKLVSAIRPKVIICLGKLTYEMVTGTVAKGFLAKLREGKPFKASIYSGENEIPVYGVAHCGARGVSNLGGRKTGKEIMRMAWRGIAKETKDMF